MSKICIFFKSDEPNFLKFGYSLSGVKVRKRMFILYTSFLCLPLTAVNMAFMSVKITVHSSSPIVNFWTRFVSLRDTN